MKQHATFSIDQEVLSKFKRIVANVSADLETYMRQKLLESGLKVNEAGVAVTRQQYDQLNLDFIRKGRQVADEEAYLRKIRKFDMLYAVAKQAGLDWQGLSNLRECKPKMRLLWTGSSGLMREFLIYLDWSERRHKLEKQLADIEDGKVKIVDDDFEKPTAKPEVQVVSSEAIPA